MTVFLILLAAIAIVEHGHRARLRERQEILRGVEVLERLEDERDRRGW